MSIDKQPCAPLATAVRKAGSQSAFGRIIGKRQSTVRYWLEHELPLPAEHVLTVERELSISRHTLRPDIYPVDHGANGVHCGGGLAANGTPVESGGELLAA